MLIIFSGPSYSHTTTGPLKITSNCYKVSKAGLCGLTNKSSHGSCWVSQHHQQSCVTWVHDSRSYPCPPGGHSWLSGALRTASASGPASVPWTGLTRWKEAWSCLPLVARGTLTRPSPGLTCVRIQLVPPCKKTFFLRDFFHHFAGCDQTCLKSTMHTSEVQTGTPLCVHICAHTYIPTLHISRLKL